jgi:hypothetical protein
MPFTEKHLTSPPPITVAGRQIKRYHVANAEGIEQTVQEAAYAFLPRLLPELDETPAAGFAVLHRGSNGAYLNAYTWVWDNVIECQTAAAGEPVLGCSDTDPTRFSRLSRPWIGCVWELPPLAHERSAWVRHMLEPPFADLDKYLLDTLAEGLVGGAG